MKHIASYFLALLMATSNAKSMIDGATNNFKLDDRNKYDQMMPEIIRSGVDLLTTHAASGESGSACTRASFDELARIAAIGRRAIALECSQGQTVEGDRIEALLFGEPRLAGSNFFTTTLQRDENAALYAYYLKQMKKGFDDNKNHKKHMGFQIKGFESWKVQQLPGGSNRALDQDTNALFALMATLPYKDYPVKQVEAHLPNGTLTHFRIEQKLKINDKIIPTYFVYALSNRVSREEYLADQRTDFLLKNPNFCILHALASDIPDLMNVAYARWKNIMSKNPTDEASITSFKKLMADFYWFHSVAAPHVRGSEAILRMMIDMTMAYKGLSFSYNDSFVFRMPFASSLSDFQTYFDENTTLESVLEQTNVTDLDAPIV